MMHMGDEFSRQDAPKTTSVKCEVRGKEIKDVPLFILKNDARKLCTHCFCEIDRIVEDFETGNCEEVPEELNQRVLNKFCNS